MLALLAFVKIEIKKKGKYPSGIKRQLRRLQKEMYLGLGRLWKNVLRLKHFTKAGGREYGYLPRKGESGNSDRKGFRRSYSGRKLQLKGHVKPLVWSGTSKRLSKRGAITATSKGVKIKVNAPALNFRNKFSKINPGREMRAFSKADEKRLSSVGEKDLTRRIERLQESEEKKLA